MTTNTPQIRELEDKIARLQKQFRFAIESVGQAPLEITKYADGTNKFILKPQQQKILNYYSAIAESRVHQVVDARLAKLEKKIADSHSGGVRKMVLGGALLIAGAGVYGYKFVKSDQELEDYTNLIASMPKERADNAVEGLLMETFDLSDKIERLSMENIELSAQLPK
ncbi:hypothetical protein DOM22_13005 [Bdellovibrio sp. ZAP7]|uniref:hypothetical protein n=1 Tax=Bdellovibrio sp. ZAP7 TaxID=2231053 RepID=UPI0011573E90|nr:hypothetical protein [Bdellovibrio sp. ZAP7]QDK46006.1 hypothetical protein DOM22_13005 [Bdellovibrio sp. ZAP7]